MDNQNRGNLVFSLSDIAKGKLPYSYEAESFCLGALFIDNQLLDNVFSKIEPIDFYEIRHQVIAKELFLLTKNKKDHPIDLITFPDYMRTQGKLEEIGGVSYLTELVESVTSLENVDYYIDIIKENSNYRKLAGIGRKIIGLSIDKKTSFDDILGQSQQFLYDLTKDKYRDFKDFRSILKKLIEEMEVNYKNRNDPNNKTGLNTGFKRLDDILLGIQSSNLVIVGGRPSMGKTAFALSIVENVAISRSNKIGVGFFSLEMSALEIASRLLCSYSKVSMEKVRKNAFEESDWPKIMRAAETMQNSQIFIDDTPRMTLQELNFKAKKMVSMGAEVIFLDYLQLMVAPESEMNFSREQFIASISRGLKILSRELEIPIIALTQLNRGLESREEKKPRLSDIRESGSIEQDADIVCFVHRPVVYAPDEEKNELKNKASIIVSKNRHGKIGEAELSFQEHFARFDNMDIYRN